MVAMTKSCLTPKPWVESHTWTSYVWELEGLLSCSWVTEVNSGFPVNTVFQQEQRHSQACSLGLWSVWRRSGRTSHQPPLLYLLSSRADINTVHDWSADPTHTHTQTWGLVAFRSALGKYQMWCESSEKVMKVYICVCGGADQCSLLIFRLYSDPPSINDTWLLLDWQRGQEGYLMHPGL